jgi:3-phosphoshikimate 1-carboxyvinyltransferase
VNEITIEPRGPLRGALCVPGDKSIGHRALLINALTNGKARVRGAKLAGDLVATMNGLRALGVEISVGQDEITVKPPKSGFSEPPRSIDCQNSGTTMRVMTGILASQPFHSVLTGDESLLRRPMMRVVHPLREMGATIDGRANAHRAPLAIRGGVLGFCRHDLKIASAQVKTAILLAGLENGVALREPRPSRDHTERMLHAMGAGLRRAKGWLILTPSMDRLRPLDVEVPGDISQAAFAMVAASLVRGSEVIFRRIGCNESRCGIVAALKSMGADIEVDPHRHTGIEPIADIVVRQAPLHGARIDGDLTLRCLDELPVLAVAAAFAEGDTVIADAGELRAKESDRIERTISGLRALGVEVESRQDGMVISGGRPRGPARVDAANDHRIAMSFAIAGMAAQGGVTIVGADAIESSYPDFFETMEALIDG